MPQIKDLCREVSRQLSLEFNLSSLETYADRTTEGWLKYSLSFHRGQEPIFQINGNIHDNDLRHLETILSNSKAASYEPLEPDFNLEIMQNEDGNDNEFLVECMLNYGVATGHTYTKSAIGIRLVASRSSLLEFASQLKLARSSFTHDTEFTDYEAIPLADNQPHL